MLCIALFDFGTQKIPDAFLIALFITATAVTLMDKETPRNMHVLGCAIGFLTMYLIRMLGEKIKKQEVLGMGDVYLSGILGLLLGLQKYLLCGIITSLLALITVRVIRFKKSYDKMHTYPFSPFFLFGYIASCLFGSLIIEKFTLMFIGGI